MDVSALAGTISAPFAAGTGSTGVARRLRSAFSLAVAVGILAVALPAAFGSGASAGVSPVQVFSSGSLVAAQTSGGARLSIAGIVPGQSRSATIRVSNAGSAAASFSLTVRNSDRVAPGGAPLSGALTLRIQSVGQAGPALYQGSPAGMSRLALGRIPAGGERSYRFTIALPGSVGNEVQGSSLSSSFAWNAA
jgi:hypothetical protein